MVGGIISPVGDAYGKQGLVSAKHRVAMAKIALQTSDWVSVDDWESHQPDWTETVVSMRYALTTFHPSTSFSVQAVYSALLSDLENHSWSSFSCLMFYKHGSVNGKQAIQSLAIIHEYRRVMYTFCWLMKSNMTRIIYTVCLCTLINAHGE